MAMILTWGGLGLSGLLAAAAMVYLWAARPETGNSRDGWAPWVNGLLAGMLVFVVLSWSLPAVGIVLSAVRAGRGSNSARVTLAGVLSFCAMTHGGMVVTFLSAWMESVPASEGRPGYDWNLMSAMPWVLLAAQAVCCAIAIAVVILLVVPATNRYFSPGPGKRFITPA
ncbi:hypothetical protein [Krasilnikovia sp. MM14-A1259]|uniref:hypothetical protein n=1 Tax=Krasilnikovia sp. MM14-A1259 TaxID=3373539 RepID=UPI00399CE8E7